MPKYTVEVLITLSHEVEAKDEAEAEDIVRNMPDSELIGEGSRYYPNEYTVELTQ